MFFVFDWQVKFIISQSEDFSQRLTSFEPRDYRVVFVVQKTVKPQGFSLKGTKIDQWVKAGTEQAKIRSSNKVIGFLSFINLFNPLLQLLYFRIRVEKVTTLCYGTCRTGLVNNYENEWCQVEKPSITHFHFITHFDIHEEYLFANKTIILVVYEVLLFQSQHYMQSHSVSKFGQFCQGKFFPCLMPELQKSCKC